MQNIFEVKIETILYRPDMNERLPLTLDRLLIAAPGPTGPLMNRGDGCWLV